MSAIFGAPSLSACAMASFVSADQRRLVGDFRQFLVEMRDEVAGNPLVPEDVRLRQRLPRKQDRVEIRIRIGRGSRTNPRAP